MRKRNYYVIWIQDDESHYKTSVVGCFDRQGAEEMMRDPEQFNVTHPKRIRARQVKRYTDDPQLYIEEVVKAGYYSAY